jgi:GDP-4-dehydro-6-deoxy-D-mannose reductase
VRSGAVYETVNGSAVTADDAIAATPPYVVSKFLIETQADYYRWRGLVALVVRPFNHIGPGQAPGFIVPDLVNQLAKSSANDAITVGNLDSARDYTDVRDIVRAYRLLLEKPDPQESTYSVCSRRAYTGRQLPEAICVALGWIFR